MNWPSWLIWGFAATAVLTTLMAGSEGIGLTRMNIPHMLGTMFTPNRDRAKVYGAALHFLNGWAFSIVYVAGLPRRAPLHLVVRDAARAGARRCSSPPSSLPVMPGVHPRMASELRGPTVARQLEPPGFLALQLRRAHADLRADRAPRVRRDAGRLLLAGRSRPSSSRRPGTASLASSQPGVQLAPRLQRQRGRARVDAQRHVEDETARAGAARRSGARSRRSVNACARWASPPAAAPPKLRAGCRPARSSEAVPSILSVAGGDRNATPDALDIRDRAIARVVVLERRRALRVHVTLNRFRTWARHRRGAAIAVAATQRPQPTRRGQHQTRDRSGRATLARTPRISAARGAHARDHVAQDDRMQIASDEPCRSACCHGPRRSRRRCTTTPRAPAPARSRGGARKDGSVPGRNSVKPARASAASAGRRRLRDLVVRHVVVLRGPRPRRRRRIRGRRAARAPAPPIRSERSRSISIKPPCTPDQRAADGVEARVDPFAPQHLRHQLRPAQRRSSGRSSCSRRRPCRPPSPRTIRRRRRSRLPGRAGTPGRRASDSAGTSTAISTMCSATPTSVVAGPRNRAAIPSCRSSSASTSPCAASVVSWTVT